MKLDFFNMDRMTIIQKLMVMTGAILMLSGSVFFYIVTEIRQSDAVINGVIDDQENILNHLAKLERAQKLFDDYKNWLTHMALSWRAESEEQADISREELVKVLAELGDSDTELVQLVEPQMVPFHGAMVEALDWYIDNNRAEGNKSLAKASSIAESIDQKITARVDEVRLQLSQATAELVANNSALLNDALYGLVLSVVFGTFLAIFMSRSITRPIGADPGEVSKVAREIAGGNLLLEAQSGSRAKITGVYAAIVAMKTKLTEVIAVVQDVSAQVRRGAAEILQANMSLNKRAEEQASNLERTAASMEEMTATVKQNANNSRQANDLVKDARTEAERGGLVVKDAVNAMVEISKSSSRIADIIGVIDEIAFQTNLLALNASVEAARAGEQGRGFAVVASEVRALAGRSASAAKEIKALIVDSVGKVEGGSHLVNETGQALERIVASVTKVSEIVGEISIASQEQASGIEQVNHAVMRMEDMTQQNAALVEEVTAACMSLGDKAAVLDKSISFFRISDHSPSKIEDERIMIERDSRGESATDTRRYNQPALPKESQSRPYKSTKLSDTESSAAKDLWEEF
jgi:methyl-accepting chemotaxis protein